MHPIPDTSISLKIAGKTVEKKIRQVSTVESIEYSEVLGEPFCLKIRSGIELNKGTERDKFVQEMRHADVSLEIFRHRIDKVPVFLAGRVATVRSVDPDGDAPGRGKEVLSKLYDGLFELTVGPALGFLAHHQSGARTWENRSYAEVLHEVLSDELKPYKRQVLSQVVQKRREPRITRSPEESTLSFCQRLMMAAGISGFFEFEEGKSERFVLVSRTSDYPRSVHLIDRPIAFSRQAPGLWMSLLGYVAQTGPSRVEYAGFDGAETPNLPVEKDVVVDDSMPVHATKKHWNPLRHGLSGDVDAPYALGASKEAERWKTQMFGLEVRSNILDCFAGRRFKLNHEGRDFEAVVTSVAATWSASEHFTATLRLAPTKTPAGAAVTVLPSLTSASPGYFGLTQARVVSSGGTVDSDGRIWCKVRYIWDASKHSDEPVVRVPVMQPMGGRFGGTQWIPRRGDVVLIGFLEGNRQSPIVLGCQYDVAQSPLPIGPAKTEAHMVTEATLGSGKQLPSSSSWLGWVHSSITKGGDPSTLHRSMMAMNVSEGAEMMYLHTPRDYRVDAKRNADIWTGGESTHKVEGQHAEDIGGKYTQVVRGESVCEVKKNQTVTVVGNHDLRVRGATGDQVLGMHGTVSAMTTLKAAAPDITVAGATTVKVIAPAVLLTGVAPGSDEALGAGLALDKNAVLSGIQLAEMTCKQSSVKVREDDVAVRSDAVALDASGCSASLKNGQIVLDADKGFTLKCGSSTIKVTKKGVEISCDTLSVKAKRSAGIDTKKAALKAKLFDVSG